jgi:dienelactone hydrolase
MPNGMPKMGRSAKLGRIAGLLILTVHGSALAAGDAEPFARSPQFALAALSPNGEILSYVEHRNDKQVLVLREIRSQRERATLTVEAAREQIRWCDWVGTRHVLCGTLVPVREPDRVAHATRLHVVHVDTGQVRELNRKSADPIRDHVVGILPGRAPRVLIHRDPTISGHPEVAELDVETGELHRVVRSHPPVRRWLSDRAGRVALGIGYQEQIASLHIRGASDDDWLVFTKQSLADPELIGPLAFGAGEDLYALKHHKGRAALFRIDIRESPPAAQLVFADPLYDVTGPVTFDPVSGIPLSVRYVREEETQHTLHESESERLRWIDAQLSDIENLIIDRSDDGRRFIVRSASDTDPPSLYLFDTSGSSLSLIGHSYPELEGRELAPMRSIAYRARDGQTIPAYLTLPLGEQSEELPAIVLPHGGPEARSWKTFDPLVQFLAAEGYAVLQMNFRGSFGYGAGFAAAGARQWGGVIHNDITDGARWLVEQNIADATRVCIVGISFGGYAALLGATRESQWYACAASYAGVSDLLALSQYTERLLDADIWRQRLGEDSRALWQMSPMGRVHAVETPVLMVHGRNDAVVPLSQSRRFARTLRGAGKPHRFVERADCDHEMSVESCRLAFYSELATFLSEHIKP